MFMLTVCLAPAEIVPEVFHCRVANCTAVKSDGVLHGKVFEIGTPMEDKTRRKVRRHACGQLPEQTGEQSIRKQQV